ncbi:unnamed protein product [Brassicogethes aeneus]|uniref:SEA domain-containing protein n=1 Tax=Brassicogethes aeneus TaxID=1431903 RepID=A0A9P0BBQ0_BRAAE|nr:unnamed protein product [Brassicogethes aeneus]CAH0558660.1 unnamed protein product [Brassicogethes aeneus]
MSFKVNLCCVLFICVQVCFGQKHFSSSTEDYIYEDNDEYHEDESYLLDEDFDTHVTQDLPNHENLYKNNDHTLRISIPTTHRPNYAKLLNNGYRESTTLNKLPKIRKLNRSAVLSKIDDKSIIKKTFTNLPNNNDETDRINKEYEDTVTEYYETIPTNLNLESVISVVTTKSVINNTVVPSFVTLSANKEDVSDIIVDTTDNWMVLGSIQTSKSISELRLFDIYDEEEKIKTNIKVGTIEGKLKSKSSTESLIDKLDRVQSDLSNRLLTADLKDTKNNLTIIQDNHGIINNTTENLKKNNEESKINIGFEFSDISTHLKHDTSYKKPSLKTKNIKEVLPKIQPVEDISKFLPPSFATNSSIKHAQIKNDTYLNSKQNNSPEVPNNLNLKHLFNQAKLVDISAFLPSKFSNNLPTNTSIIPTITTKPTTVQDTINTNMYFPKIEKNNISTTRDSKITNNEKHQEDSILKNTSNIDLSSFLNPDYKMGLDITAATQSPESTTMAKSNNIKLDNIFKNIASDDLSSFLPPGYKIGSDITATQTVKNNFNNKGLLPSDYKFNNNSKSEKNMSVGHTNQEKYNIKADDVSIFLPPGYKLHTYKQTTTTTDANKYRTSSVITSTMATPTSTSTGVFKVVYPTRKNKKISRTTTTSKNTLTTRSTTQPTIHIGWPSRATTVFTGWPTSSTTPISIEKLLEAAKSTTTTTEKEEEITVYTTTTSTTTTTIRPTTPGTCETDCDLAGTIKLLDGVKWTPELLDRNTKEWQILSNEVKTQLEDIFRKSAKLNKWLKKIRIDGFSKGSVLVDYFVELKNLDEKINTAQIKNLFYQSLKQDSINSEKFLDDDDFEETLGLGKFVLDSNYTDFVVIPRQYQNIFNENEEKLLLPQWTIAAIVIGLASLLFVIIFGVTVIINREKNYKKQLAPSLSHGMLNHIDKNSLGRLENYGAQQHAVYDLEWITERDVLKKEPGPKNNFDSWKSDWNGHYFNAYYGKNSQMYDERNPHYPNSQF